MWVTYSSLRIVKNYLEKSVVTLAYRCHYHLIHDNIMSIIMLDMLAILVCTNIRHDLKRLSNETLGRVVHYNIFKIETYNKVGCRKYTFHRTVFMPMKQMETSYD